MHRFTATFTVLALVASASVSAQQLIIARNGSRAVRSGPATNFTGDVRVEMLFEAIAPAHASGGSVTFEPGARTAWHTHPRGQVLIVTAGIGRVQRWGDAIVEVHPGDVVRIPPGQKHWHGAALQSSMTHIAITESVEGSAVEWLEQVSDEQYGATPANQNASTSSQAPNRMSGPLQQKIAPGLAALTDDVLFGDVWRRPDLSARDRSLVTIAVLIATGKSAQLSGHLGRGLDNGIQASEASAVLAHLAVYAGWPSAVSALEIYDQVYTARKIDPASLRVTAPRLAASEWSGKVVSDELGTVAPKFVQLTTNVVLDDLWRRPDLSPRDRSLVTIAALAAMGDDDQLPPYLQRAMESGLTRNQIAEAMTHLGFYAGWPKATKALAAVARSTTQSPSPASVRVATGQLQGVVADGVVSFKGVPFAAPPVGELRWRPPQPPAAWTGVRQASEFGPSCMQGFGGPPPGARGAAPPAAPAPPAPSEDCLYLNIWRPADQTARNLPVMVWIYGGGFVGGSSSSPQTSGHAFAKQGVVLVAMNYRVGRFGFFAFPALTSERPSENKGNYAYMDQIAALQWVKQNIAAFGGNPNNVTIFGFSAGGVSVHSMLASPQARGLFHKAIVESGGSRDSVLTARPLRDDNVDPNYPVSAETIGVTFAKSMGIEGTDAAALEKLRALTAEQVLRGAPSQPGAASVPPVETTPILDGKLVTETAETAYKAKRQPRVSLMLGSNSADTAGNRIRARTKEELFTRYGQWSDEAKAAYDPDGTTDIATMVSRANDDFGQAEPARFAANAFAANGSPVFLYRFSYVLTAMREMARGGAPHGGEIGFVFGTLSSGGGGRGGPPSADDLAVSRMAQSYWVNFAKTGDPNGSGLPAWPRHVAGRDQIFDFRPDGTAGSGPDVRKARLDVTQKATESGKRSDQ